MKQQADTSKDDEQHPSHLSLFEGDLLNRAFAAIGIGSKGPLDIILRIFVVIGICWLPMAVAAYIIGPYGDSYAENFFYDFAAYGQLFVGLPLFIIAERVVADNLRAAGRDFYDSGVVAEADKPVLLKTERKIAVWRKRLLPEIILIVLAYAIAACALTPELFSTNTDMKTWHTHDIGSGHARFTLLGWYATLVTLPIETYWWLRWVWKIALWYWYLSRVSNFRLTLVASHPDSTGGIGFLSEVQAKFALVILAYGVSNVVATIGYKIAIENAAVTLMPIFATVVAFIVGAPTLFLAPLLLFTKQLARTKKRALAQFREKAMTSARLIEEQWLHSETTPENNAQASSEMSRLNLLSGFYERIHGMRVVPFDLRSAAQLVGSAIAPMIPLLPYLIDIPKPWLKILEALAKWLPH